MLRRGEVQVFQPVTRHTCWNPTASPSRLLLICAPGGAHPGPGPWDTS